MIKIPSVQKRLFLLLGLLLIASALAFVAAYLQKDNNSQQTPSDTSSKQGYKRYANHEYGISFEYPTDWEIRDGNPFEGELLRVGIGEVAGVHKFSGHLWLALALLVQVRQY